MSRLWVLSQSRNQNSKGTFRNHYLRSVGITSDFMLAKSLPPQYSVWTNLGAPPPLQCAAIRFF